RTLAAMGLVVLRTPIRAPQANAFCERVIGTVRRECLDFVIPMNERHLRAVLRDWCSHYNRGRPHASLGPGIAERPVEDRITQSTGHRLPDGYRVAACITNTVSSSRQPEIYVSMILRITADGAILAHSGSGLISSARINSTSALQAAQ